jgi:hypothetical protein
MPQPETSVVDLETPDRLSHHRWEWSIERVGWVVMALILAAALLGLAGPGPLSHRTVANSDGSLSVEYYAAERYEAPGKLLITLHPKEGDAKPVQLAISRSFTDETTSEQIVPRPVAMESIDDNLVLTFRAGDLAQNGRVIYQYQYDSFGSFKYQIGIVGHEPVQVSQFVYP